jgi:hypothetical protein
MAVLGQKWEENNCLMHQNLSAPLDGMYGSKAIDKTLLGVSSVDRRPDHLQLPGYAQSQYKFKFQKSEIKWNKKFACTTRLAFASSDKAVGESMRIKYAQKIMTSKVPVVL